MDEWLQSTSTMKYRNDNEGMVKNKSVSKKVWELIKEDSMDENQIYQLMRDGNRG